MYRYATRTLLIGLSVLFTMITGYSQSSIAGTVVDTDNNPLSYVNVLLLNSADSSLVKGSITRDDGSYTIAGIAAGTYLVEVSSVGYEDNFSNLLTLDGHTQVDRGTTVLSVASTLIETVEVTAKKPLYEQKVDRLVVNVANSITAAGGNALEVLERSPGVMVNRQLRTLSMNGKSGVIIMINNKITQMPADAVVQMLSGMSADNIERIELIHTPPANFEAEGNAGIIHIVLKESPDAGLNGSYSLSAGYGKKEKFGADLTMNYRKDRVNLFGNYSANFDNNPQIFTNYRRFELDNRTFETSGSSDRDPTKTLTQQARLGLDYKFSDKTVVGILAGWSDRYWTMDAINSITKSIDGQLDEIIRVPNDEINHWQNILGNINYEHKFSEDRRLNIDFDYVYYYFTNPTNYTNEYYNANNELTSKTLRRVDKVTPMSILVGKADYTSKFGKKLTWETGVKATATRFDNNVLVEDQIGGLWTRDPRFSADYSMEEDIAAAYTSFSWDFAEHTAIKAGVRYEYTRADLGTAEEPHIVDRTYGNLFPSVFFSHSFSDKNQLQASYSRRINRPDFNQLAPYFIFYDPTTIETGNPALQPSTTDAYSVNYRLNTVSLNVEYSMEHDAIAGYQPDIDVENDVQVNGARNFDYARYFVSTLSFPLHPTKWWEIRSNITGFWNSIKDVDAEGGLKFSQSSWFYNGTMSFTLPKKYTAEITGQYFSKTLYGSAVWDPFSQVSVGLQKEFADNKGTLRFNVNDIFLTANWRGELREPEHNILIKTGYIMTERTFRLTYSRNFGNSKLKAARNRQTGSEEERRRVH